MKRLARHNHSTLAVYLLICYYIHNVNAKNCISFEMRQQQQQSYQLCSPIHIDHILGQCYFNRLQPIL